MSQISEGEVCPKSLREETDESLVTKFQKGNELAFEVLLSRYKRPLYNFIFKFTRNLEATEEAFQEVFLRVIRSLDEYRPQAKFSTWLYTIARNYCVDLCRKEKFRQHLPFDNQNSDNQVLQYSSDDPGADHRASATELQKHLYRILDELNQDQKEVFIMREYQGLSFDEIARVTQTSTNTVKSRMRYALQAIQKRFEELGITSC